MAEVKLDGAHRAVRDGQGHDDAHGEHDEVLGRHRAGGGRPAPLVLADVGEGLHVQALEHLLRLLGDRLAGRAEVEVLAHVGERVARVGHRDGGRLGLGQQQLRDVAAVLGGQAVVHQVERLGGQAQCALGRLRAQVVGDGRGRADQHDRDRQAAARHHGRDQAAGRETPGQQHDERHHPEREKEVVE